MSETGKYVLLNRNELEAYLREIAYKFANAGAAEPLVNSLGPVLAQRAENLRVATDEDLAKYDPELIEMQTQVLGRKFYVFDPTLDSGLRDNVIKAADLVRAMVDGQEALRNLSGAPEVTPLYLRKDFLNAALSVPQPVRIKIPAATPPAEQKLDTDALKDLMRASLADILKDVNLGKMFQPDTEDSFKITGGGKIIRYISFEKLEKDNEEFGNALGAIDREQMQGAEHSYYGVIDEAGKLRAMLKTKENTLLLNRCASNKLPDADICDKVLAFARHKEMRIADNSARTGLVSTTQGLQNMFKLAEEMELNHFTLIDYPGDMPIKSLGNGARFFSEFHIEDCPEFTTIAGIKKIEGGLKIRNCPKFTDIGDITVIGDSTFGIGASFRGCANLTSLGKLQVVGGSLDIRETGVRALPDTLTSVSGFIYTDQGRFRWLRSARKALVLANKNLPPPPLMLPGPYP